MTRIPIGVNSLPGYDIFDYWLALLVDSLCLSPGVFINISIFFGGEHIILFLFQNNLRNKFSLDKCVSIQLCLLIVSSSDGVERIDLNVFYGFYDKGDAIIEDSDLIIRPMGVII